MKTYPYIGESRKNGTIVLFSSESYGVQLWRESANYQDRWNESNEFEQLITEWLAVDIECCDARDAVGELLRAEVERQVNLVCDKWGVK